MAKDEQPTKTPPKRTPAQKADFKRELTDVVPHLRAFARGLCGRPDMADDLVQETLLKAWAAQERFEPGTSMRAWTFVILRNAYLTDMRRNRFRGEYDEGVAERILTAPAGQEEPIHLSDMHRALLTLPPERREALLLVGAGGFSYEEAASICGCAVGTIKSRVGRARAALNSMLAEGAIPQRSVEDDIAHRAILEELDDVAAGRGETAKG
ncbi:MAG: sigma-70 family RNA polymerase sigma factor [Pseudomonadota bacterium]